MLQLLQSLRHKIRFAGWRQEGQDLLRGVTGGLIFGSPLLYTMEMWQRGMTFSPTHIMTLLAVILSVNFVFSLFSGLRKANQEYSAFLALSDAVTSVGLSLLISGFVLILIGRIRFDSGAQQIFGKIVLEALVISIGITFTNSRFSGSSDDEKNGKEDSKTSESESDSSPGEIETRQFKADLLEAAGTLAGSIVFSVNVAPTEEVLRIAVSLEPWQQLILLGAELLICYIILVASKLSQLEVYAHESLFQKPWVETLMATSLSLVVAAGLLWLLGYPETQGNSTLFVASAVVLGLPAVVGGAAGRLAV